MHVAAKAPLVGLSAELPKDRIDKETEIANEQVKADPKNASKPANILEKIVEGKVRAWMAENVLTDQPFVKDETKTIGQLLSGAGLKLTKFVRLRVGEVAS
jgi:elongation factor Ts